jgi:hypothetical protein
MEATSSSEEPVLTSATSQEMALLIVTAVETPNPAKYQYFALNMGKEVSCAETNSAGGVRKRVQEVSAVPQCALPPTRYEQERGA